MKKHSYREIILLALPVALIAVAGAWVTWGGKSPLRSPFDPGPIRLEYTPIQKIDLTPLDKFHGYTWKGFTVVQEMGKLALPPGWTATVAGFRGGVEDVHVEYQKDKEWAPVIAPQTSPPALHFPYGPPNGNTVILLNLSRVPPDAEAVRLRGRFGRIKTFSGLLPPGWKLPAGSQSAGNTHQIPVVSAPFDVQLKAPGEPMPTIGKTPDSPLVVQEAKWFSISDVKPHRQLFLVRLRNSQNAVWNLGEIQVENTKVYDADRHELKMVDLTGSSFISESLRNVNESMQIDYTTVDSHEVILNPEMSSPHHLLSFISSYIVPQGGWAKVKQPIHIEADISDGTCWPVHLKLQLKRESALIAQLKEFITNYKDF